MPSLKLCGHDPLVNELRNMFSASIVRVPEERIRPLTVIATRHGKNRYWGSIDSLLSGETALEIPSGARASSRMAPLNGGKSSAIDVELGLKILDGFLSGFGVLSAGVSPAFDHAAELRFSFHKIVREFVDNAWLSRALSERALDTSAGKIFIRKPRWNLLVVDSVITSPSFTLEVVKSNSGSLDLAAPVPHLIGKAELKVSVKKRNNRSLTFSSAKPLTFAFTAAQLHVEKSGAISTIEPDTKARVLADKPDGTLLYAGLDHVQLDEQPTLVELESAEEAGSS